MWVMAFSARFRKRIGMTFHGSHVFLLMTFETDLPPIFEQQGRLIGLMRVVACSAFAIGCRIMFEGRFSDLLLELIVTLKAQLVRGLNQKLLDI